MNLARTLSLLYPLIAVIAASLSPASATSIAPMKTLAETARPHGPSHAVWQTLLARYLDTAASDRVNRFRYSAVTPEDKALLAAYLDSLQAARPSALKDAERRAFWINLYNAETVSAVLRAHSASHPIQSIRDIRIPGSASPGPWDAKLLKVEGRGLSLNDIENGILRKEWRDFRIHFALNCASLGCPNLSPLAYAAANLEARLDEGARDFLRSRRGAEFKGDALYLSSIFDWYKGDFGKTDRKMLETLARFATPEMGARLRAYTGRIEYRYDWNLNGT